MPQGPPVGLPGAAGRQLVDQVNGVGQFEPLKIVARPGLERVRRSMVSPALHDREMNRLATDMNTRYDALVILHWNRTTFTRKAREICNESGQKPCVTCHYEGFTSLRRTLQETLRQLLAAEEARGA